jgi:hypothetical protein
MTCILQIAALFQSSNEQINYLAIAPVVSNTTKGTGAIVAPFPHQSFDQHGLCYWLGRN